MINAVLSGGPVGPGDRVNLTDAVMTLRSCDASGRILRKKPPSPLECPTWLKSHVLLDLPQRGSGNFRNDDKTLAWQVVIDLTPHLILRSPTYLIPHARQLVGLTPSIQVGHSPSGRATATILTRAIITSSALTLLRYFRKICCSPTRTNQDRNIWPLPSPRRQNRVLVQRQYR